MQITVNRPAIINPDKEIFEFKRAGDLEQTISMILAGKQVRLAGLYSNGLVLLQELQVQLKKNFADDAYEQQRAYRSAFRKYAHLILVKIENHRIALKKAPDIGWLKKLYPEISDFNLTFPDIQGLNSSWQWYTKGITIPVLRNKLHPYYGTYFPTRFEHLILFDNWLKRYGGPKKSAIDVGIGSGILAMQLVKHGFQKVYGTDTNPNAIIGLKEFMGDTKLSRKIEPEYGNLFGKWDKPTELIVFNPPWLPATHDLDQLDRAIYYEENLFPEFFAAAHKHLLPDGKLVLIFSNLGLVTGLIQKHPIVEELETGQRFRLEQCIKKAVKPASDKTKRNAYWRSQEEVELWVLNLL